MVTKMVTPAVLWTPEKNLTQQKDENPWGALMDAENHIIDGEGMLQLEKGSLQP